MYWKNMIHSFTFGDPDVEDLEDIEDDMCTCGRYYARDSRMCGVCIDNWINDYFITDQIRDAGFKNGAVLGYEYGIRHTLYNEARDDYWMFDDDDTPSYAYLDRLAYERSFKDGYSTAYNSVYKRHEPLFQELRVYLNRRHFWSWVFTHFQHHNLFDLEILRWIDQFVGQSTRIICVSSIHHSKTLVDKD
jgi:hypothetical protein